jgi:hypothetical protein
MSGQVNEFVKECYDYEAKLKYEDVYITDHVKPDPKYITINQEEDQELVNYLENLKKYNDTSDRRALMSFTKNQSRYPRGSLLQQIFEPLAPA